MMYRWMCYFARRRRRNFEFPSMSNILSLPRRLLRFCYHLALRISVIALWARFFCIDSNWNQNSFSNGCYQQRDESCPIKSRASFGIDLFWATSSPFSLVRFRVIISKNFFKNKEYANHYIKSLNVIFLMNITQDRRRLWYYFLNNILFTRKNETVVITC